MATTAGGDYFPWSSSTIEQLLKRTVDETIPDVKQMDSVLKPMLGQDPLPQAKSTSLYYIRAVKNNKFFGGEDKEFTIFVPEFLFVFDLGYPAKSGVLCKWEAAGSGDPDFPDFSSAIPRSIYREDSAGLIYPAVTGELMIGTRPGTPEQQVLDSLKESCTQIRRSSSDLYLAKVKPFHERQIGEQIESQFDFVKYAELNSIVRLIDFAPGWRCTKLL